jgi:hypothetical protein
MKRLRVKLTYANVVATMALFIALAGGTALAATQILPKNSVGSKQIKKEAVTPAKLNAAAKSTLTGKTGPAGPQGPQGAQGSQGSQGSKGDTGPAGTAVAYAAIEANGTVDLAHSKGISAANVEHPGTGIYCFPNLPFTVKNIIGSPDAYGPEDGILVNITFTGTPPFGGCGESPRVRITTAAAPATLSDHPFYILFN